MMRANSVLGCDHLLKIISRFSQLDFGQLMYVYEQSNAQDVSRYQSVNAENERYLQNRESFYHYLRKSFFYSKDCMYGIWAPKDHYVAAVRLEPYKDGLLLAALETAPCERGKGYATALIQALTRYLGGTKWKTVYSHVDKNNKGSLAVHRACGFERILEHAAFIDGSVSHSYCTLRLRIK